MIIATILHWNILTIINRAQYHLTRAPLETAVVFSMRTSIGVNVWVSIVVVGANSISRLYCSIM